MSTQAVIMVKHNSPRWQFKRPSYSSSYKIKTLQAETRERQNFSSVEASLPDPHLSKKRHPAATPASSLSTPLSSLSHRLFPSSLPSFPSLIPSIPSLSSYLGTRNPLAKDTVDGEILWLFDAAAYRVPSSGGRAVKHGAAAATGTTDSGASSSWEMELNAAVFRPNTNYSLADVVASVASHVGLADDADEREILEDRLKPFSWDIRPAKRVQLLLNSRGNGTSIQLGPTGPSGTSSNVVKVPGSVSAAGGVTLVSEATSPGNIQGILEAKTFFSGPEGWGVISDIDDTIKVTQTSDPIGILQQTFVEPATAIAGMPELYAEMKNRLLPPGAGGPDDTPWVYLSASPYNLYPLLRNFRDDKFPGGPLLLRDSSWRTVSGLLGSLTEKTEEYKVGRIRKVRRWFPSRKFVCVGDSTQSDPEAYGKMYREYSGWIKLILIRKATDIAAVGIEAKNESGRFEKAFKGIPREAWFVFEDPAECIPVIMDAVQRNE